MREAVQMDRKLVVDILSNAFDDNMSVNYIVSRGPDSGKRIRALMKYSFDLCFEFGKVYIGDDGVSCALILYPEKKKTTTKSIWLDLVLIFNAIGLFNVFKALRREKTVKEGYKPTKMLTAYLWFIGVYKEYQKKGQGSRLLEELCDSCRQEKRELFLETSVLTNISWYERFGFTIYNQIDFGYTLFFLKKDN